MAKNPMDIIAEFSGAAVDLQGLESYRQTVARVAQMARRYKADARVLLDLSLLEIYELLRKLPYRPDPEGVEVLNRPALTLARRSRNPRDCDDKAIVVGAFCELTGRPWRIIVAGRESRPHHIYVEIRLQSGRWIPFDPTYPSYRIARRGFPEKTREVYYPDSMGD